MDAFLVPKKAHPDAKPLEPFGRLEHSRCRNTGRRVTNPTAQPVAARPSVQLPAGIERKPGYKECAAKNKAPRRRFLSPPLDTRNAPGVLGQPSKKRTLMTAAFVFPGQGSQSVGMGKALADNFAVARAVFDEVDEALGDTLSRIMWEGPAERLTLTENAQPALMAVSLGTLRVLESEAGVDLARDAAFVAGHSLGEYSALAAAGSFTLADAARLLRIRGRAMQHAVPV